MKQAVRTIALALALIVALAYTFGYSYLFKGIAKTYLRGETSANINDGPLFPKHTVPTVKPKPWKTGSQYNKKPLPNNLVEELKKAETASLIVVKNGELVHEEYWNGYTQQTRTNSFSMAKAITVMLTGAAIADEKLSGINEKLVQLYPGYRNSGPGAHLTLKNLAQMEAGLHWDESYENPFASNAKAYYGNSLAEAVLLKGFKNQPGTHFEYQSGASQLLGFAVRRAVDKPLSAYLSEKIWQPLGMEQSAYWSTDENEMEKTFCCVHAEARDFAKIGQMMLEGGKANGAQIIPADYIQLMTTPTQHSGNAYGMGVWINYDTPLKYYLLWGFLGQYTIVIPEKNMVIVRTGNYENEPVDKKGRPLLADRLARSLASYY